MRPYFRLRIQRCADDPREVHVELEKTWWHPDGQGRRSRPVAFTALQLDQDTEAVLLADLLRELAREVEGSTYRL